MASRPRLSTTVCSLVAAPRDYGVWIFALFLLPVLGCAHTPLTRTSTSCSAELEEPSPEFVFMLSFFRDESAPTAIPQYAVLCESRILGNDLEFVRASELTRATLECLQGDTFSCNVPKVTGWLKWLPGVPWPHSPLLNTSEFRFTIFCPGYTATTVYPYGIYNSPASNPPVRPRWDRPGILSEPLHSKFGTHNDVSPIERVTVRGSTTAAVVPIESLDLAYADRGPQQPFVVQVKALAEAIRAKQLRSADKELKALILESVERQFAAYSKNVDDYRNQPSYSDSELRKEATEALAAIRTWTKE